MSNITDYIEMSRADRKLHREAAIRALNRLVDEANTAVARLEVARDDEQVLLRTQIGGDPFNPQAYEDARVAMIRFNEDATKLAQLKDLAS